MVTKKRLAVIITVLMMVCIGASVGLFAEASAISQKHVIIWSLKGNKLQYYKAYSASEYLKQGDWDNTIGAGKRKSIKVSSKAKYYLLKPTASNPNKICKVSKKKFIKNLYETSKHKENGKTWYWGTACKLTIKKGKVVKFVQEFQS